MARVALVGDTKQLKAVDAGQPFRLLQKAGMATATMKEVKRQRDPELRAAVGLAREGEPGAAIAELGNRVTSIAYGDSYWDKRAIPDREHYEPWRNGTDEVVAAAEDVLANRRKYGIHLDGMARRGKSFASALSDVREVLREDDRHIAASLAGQREGENERAREDRIARLLDDPEQLKNLRRQRAERKEARRREERRHKGRYQRRGMSM